MPKNVDLSLPDPDSPSSGVSSFAEFLGAKKPNRRRYKMLTDPTLLMLVNDARQAVIDAGAGRIDSVEYEQAQEHLDCLVEQLKSATVTFEFEAIDSDEFDEMIAEHPPTKAQKDRVSKAARDAGLPRSRQVGPMWNPDTFPPVLIAATMVEPFRITVEQAHEMWESGKFTDAELAQMFNVAVEVQTEAPRV